MNYSAFDFALLNRFLPTYLCTYVGGYMKRVSEVEVGTSDIGLRVFPTGFRALPSATLAVLFVLGSWGEGLGFGRAPAALLMGPLTVRCRG